MRTGPDHGFRPWAARFQVEERKRKLDGRTLSYPCLGLERSHRQAVLRYDLDHVVDLAGLEIPAGAVSYGVYWTDRPYNVYHWTDAAGTTLAYYCNAACETVIGPDFVDWLDLELDALITPDGRVRLLDEDEVPPHLSVAYRRCIDEARLAFGAAGALTAAVEACTRPHRPANPPARS